MDENWVHYLQPESKQEPKQMKHPGSAFSKKAMLIMSATSNQIWNLNRNRWNIQEVRFQRKPSWYVRW